MAAKSLPVGSVFGKLTVIGDGERNRHNQPRSRCKCDCGSDRLVENHNLKRGHTKSCGCTRAAGVRAATMTHGNTLKGAITGEYWSWTAMRARCSRKASKAYPDYGGRGITVCERWQNSFANFLADMGPKPSPKHSIERKENSGNYEPGNCMWATRKEQNNNSRHNVRITIDGETLTLTEWAKKSGTHYMTIYRRRQAGVPDREAVWNPRYSHRRKPSTNGKR